MMERREFLGKLAMAVATAASPLPVQASPTAPALPGDPARGQQLFARYGATCHGANLEGSVGPRLNPIAKLSGVSHPLDPDYLIATITNGRPASDGFGAMPAKGGADLTDQDIKDLAAFIIQENRKGGGGALSPVELARSNVFWVGVGTLGLALGAYLLSRYNMRWIARRAAQKQ